MYDVLLSILYAWSVFQAYVYDAKTRTTGILIYVLEAGASLEQSRFGSLLPSDYTSHNKTSATPGNAQRYA
jgi:hypothetical protein